MADTVSAGRAMFPPQRHDRILALLHRDGLVDVAKLAEAFDVTTETVRRDLSDLQRRRLVRRVHGGAIPWESGGFEPLLSQRDVRNVDEKRRIAAAAIQELPPEGCVILDSGSTTARVAQQLPPDSALTIVTNSVLIAQLLANHRSVDVVVLGGAFDKNTLATVDGQTVAAVRQLRVDALVLGADGISANGGLTTPSRAQAELKGAMIAAARRVLAVIDHSKVGNDQFIRFAECREVDTLITGTAVDLATAAGLEEAGVDVLRV